MNILDDLGNREDRVMGLVKMVRDHIPFHNQVMLFHYKRNYKGSLFLVEGAPEIVPNTITELGDAQVADAMSDRTSTVPSNCAVGTGTLGKTAASTVLVTEFTRQPVDTGVQGVGAADNDVIWTTTFTAMVGTPSLKEAGMFNAANPPGGIMFCYTDYSAKIMDPSDTLIIVWTLTCGAS
jgi:hypothetical protein